MSSIKRILLGLLFLGLPALAQAEGTLTSAGGGTSGLPSVGAEGTCLLVSGGIPAWGACPGAGTGAPTDATYILKTANATLTAEQALGALGTGVMLNTTTTGVVSIYGGATCTNQVLRVLSASGAGTCNTITSAFVDTTVWTGTASSGLLKASSQGILTAAVAGTDYLTAPVNLATSVTGVTPVANGGTGLSTVAVNQLLVGTNTAVLTAKTLPSCSSGTTSKLLFDSATQTFTCGTDQGGAGSGTSVGAAGAVQTSDGAAGFVDSGCTASGGVMTCPTFTGAATGIRNSSTLPATCSVGQVYQDTDATTGQQFYACEAVNTWVLQGAAPATPTLDQVFDQGKIIDGATSLANAFRFGGATTAEQWCGYMDAVTGLQLRPCTDAHVKTLIPTNFTWALRDEEGAADIETIDPDAASVKAMYTYGTAYKPLKTVPFMAGSLYGDGTQCPADPTAVTINSGPKIPTFICTDNDAATLYGSIKMPDSWDAGTVTFEHLYIQTAADTGVLNGDIAAQCRGNGEAPSSTWGTEVALDDAAVTGSSKNDFTTSAAVTPAGTCAAGDMLYFRYQLDATGTTTAVATLHHVGFKMEYSITSRSD